MSFSHGGAAVFGSRVRPVERDELDVAGYLRREKNRVRRERESWWGFEEREGFVLFFPVRERERERERNVKNLTEFSLNGSWTGVLLIS